MNADQIRLIVGSGIVILVCIIRSGRKRDVIQPNDFVEIAWAIGGTVLTSGLLVKAFTNSDLLTLVGTDGVLALLVGAGSQIVSSLSSELQKDFFSVWQFFTSRKP